MNKTVEKAIAAVTAAIMSVCGISTASASASVGYSQYLRQNALLSENQSVSAVEGSITIGGLHTSGAEGFTEWKVGDGELTAVFDNCNDAFYNVEIVWKAEKGGVNPTFGVKLDGSFPYAELENVELQREWKNLSSAPGTDEQGNEYAPEQTETGEFITSVLKDLTGKNSKPFSVRTTAGTHTLTLTQPGQPLSVKSIRLLPQENPIEYGKLSKGYGNEKNDAEPIIIEAESADIKTSKTIIPKSNNSDAGMSPSDVYKQKINYIGGTSWQSPGSALTWKFNVDTAGYYYVSFRYKQSDLINGRSLRKLRIDGTVPFKEALQIPFPYTTGWKYADFESDDGEKYLIRLEAGEHTLTLEATVGDSDEFVNRLSDITEKLGNKYIDIIMITGETPDTNTDYEIFSQIPDLEESFKDCSKELGGLADDMKTETDGGSTQCIAAIENMKRVVDNMLRSPYVAQQYLSDYYSNYTSVASWLNDMSSMPLSLDYIELTPYGADSERKTTGFFEDLVFGIKKLAVSFIEDYSVVKEENAESSIRIWVNWGQEQAAALSNIISDSFTKETGIRVNLEIVNASLINGILAGNFPDVTLQMARTEPVNLGIRGALCDLNEFDDCAEVLKRFLPGSEIPYGYNDKLYALPDSESFFIMFVRTDIMESLKLDIPETWEEFLHVASIIQRNNMNVYLPYTQITSVGTVNVGIGSLNMLPTLFSQNGLPLYNADMTATALTSSAAVNVFEKWTRFYTHYNFLKEADFYNRFRLGSMPLGIAPIATYMNLYATAPEIKGRWTLATVPGTVKEDGTLDKSIAGAGTGCGIVGKSAKKQEAWEFLKWWTSASAQKRYNNSVESVLGVISRSSTSNIEAFDSFAWNPDDLAVIKEQRKYIKEIEEIPGSYYLSRSVDQAFWNVVNNESNAKDALVKWSKIADSEMKRKIKEYS